jgi:hypothetical protein
METKARRVDDDVYRLTPRSGPKILIFALLGRALASLLKIWMK